MSTADRLDHETGVPGDRAEAPDKPEGPIVAAILAGGIGCLALGVFTTLAEASTSVADKLAWSDKVGPLSGKTIMTVILWLVSWAILHAVYRNRAAETKQALTIALVLIGLGVLLTFPTFFQLFAPAE
jgi:heme/copper-type cytochrome/quinol oxidase subunit 3